MLAVMCAFTQYKYKAAARLSLLSPLILLSLVLRLDKTGSCLFSGFSLYCKFFYRYNASVAVTAVEGYHSVCESIECVIATFADILARVVNSASLTNYNVACLADLSSENLNA